MSQKFVVVQQYLAWKGHYRQYFENLLDTTLYNVCASNHEENYEKSVCIRSDFDSDKPLTIGAKIKGRFGDSIKVFRHLAKNLYDAIHFIEFEPLSYLLYANKIKADTKLLITIHSSDRLHFSNWLNNQLSSFQRWLLETALRKAVSKGAYIVTHYECHRKRIIDVIGECYTDRVSVIHYPAPRPDVQKPRSRSGKQRPSFLIYGQIREDKGIYEFLQNESTQNLSITIAGKIVDRRIFEFRDRPLLTIIDKFLSEAEIDDLIERHDYMLLPYPEAYTNGAGTFKDSLSKAMPVVCSKIDIFREIVDEFEVGLIFEHVDEIAERIENVTAEEYSLWSKNCLQYAVTYDWDYMRREYHSLYEKLLPSNPKG